MIDLFFSILHQLSPPYLCAYSVTIDSLLSNRKYTIQWANLVLPTADISWYLIKCAEQKKETFIMISM